MAELGRVALTTFINTNINTNGVKAITGANHNSILIDMKDSFYNKVDDRPYVGLKTYAPTTVYDTGDTVIYDNDIYEANQDTVTGAWDPTKWDKVLDTVADFEEGVDDRVAALIQNGTGLTWTYNDLANTLTGNVGGLTTTEFASANVSQWTNDANYLSGSGTATYVSFYTGSTTQSGDSKFIWNNTNKNLGLGAAPDAGFQLHIKESTNKAQLRIESTTTENAVLSLVHSATGGAGDRNSAITFKEDATTHWTMGLNGTGGGADDEFVIVNGTDMDTSPVLVAQKTNGYVGINTGTGVNPAALLHVGAATTSAASIRITSSAATDVASPVTGDLWWNGTNLYFYNGTANTDLLAGGGGGLSDIVDDTTPQLGGDLDVNGNIITSSSGGNVTISPNGSGVATIEAGSGGVTIQTTSGNSNVNITPHGTGNVTLGNMTFDADQTVGAGQDNYVLTYDHSAGVISLEAAAGGSSVFTIDAGDNLFGGTQSGTALTPAANQRCFFGGYRAGYLVTSGPSNVAIGDRAMSSAATTGSSNVAIGNNASPSLTSGFSNVAIGREAGYALATSQHNIMIGHRAGNGVTGNRNICMGYYTGSNAGNDNTIIGVTSSSTSSYGDKNVILGRTVANQGDGNICIGYNVQQSGNVTGDGNIFIHPSHAGTSTYNAVSGSNNCVIGLDIEVPTALSNYVSLYDLYRGDHSAGEAYQACPSTAAADADLNNSEVHFSVDESGNNFQIKVKYSTGVVKTATVAVA